MVVVLRGADGAGALREVYADRVRGQFLEVLDRARILKEHRAIADAIAGARGEEAEARMRSHLRYASGRTRAASGGLFSEVVDWGDGGVDPARPC